MLGGGVSWLSWHHLRFTPQSGSVRVGFAVTNIGYVGHIPGPRPVQGSCIVTKVGFPCILVRFSQKAFKKP